MAKYCSALTIRKINLEVIKELEVFARKIPSLLNGINRRPGTNVKPVALEGVSNAIFGIYSTEPEKFEFAPGETLLIQLIVKFAYDCNDWHERDYLLLEKEENCVSNTVTYTSGVGTLFTYGCPMEKKKLTRI